MKKLLTLALAVVALAAFTGLGAAQEKDKEKSRPTGVEKKQPAPGEKTIKLDKPILQGVKVTQVNEKAKTFTVMAKGKEITINAAKLKSLPKVGDTVYINAGIAVGDPGCIQVFDKHGNVIDCVNA
jgi:trimethylamine:corrinoid methyltransferase-like protein